MAKYYTNTEELELVADAIREKGGTSAQLTFPNEFVSAIKAIPASNSGGSSSKKDVVFYDYDGTVVESYTANEFASLSAMPTNPTHTGLIAQGWNWSLANAKTYVAKYDKLNIGQMYVTQSGATEIDVEMHEGRLEPILTICVNGTITVDWGDNTTPDTITGSSLLKSLGVPHAYASEGNYTISILATGNNKYIFSGSASYQLLRKNDTQNENRTYSNTIKHVRIGNNAGIESYAFVYCGSLLSITIPDSITSIGSYAFNYCYSLSSVAIPDGITSIGSTAFSSCYSLSSVAIPDGITSIGSSAFSSCYSLSRIIIPDRVTSIGNNAFYNCQSLSSIAIPDGVTSMGNSVFANCYSLSSIVIPDGIKSIGNNVFQNCYSLSRVTIPNSVTSIGNGAFNNCFSLSSITIPDGVASIVAQVFQNCYSLSRVTIPDSVTSIGNSAFSSCYGVKEYHILPTTVPTIVSNIFSNIVSDCIIYVPKGHLTDYQTASNWSTYASYMQEEPT